MKNTMLQFQVHSVRTLTSPYSKEEKKAPYETIYYLLVNMKDLPENIPLDVNPRRPKMTTNVAKSLIKAVLEPETDFYINNRGIVISAYSLSYDTTKSIVSLDLGNQEDEVDANQYGILDGGHTYTAIMENRKAIPADVDKYVRIEVVTNVQNITRLSDARNTSVQVSDIALFNLDDKFGDVKLAIKEQPYANKIAYKDNDRQPIHISEIIRLMFAVDVEKYPDDQAAPVQSYSGKAQVFKHYASVYNSAFYRSLTTQVPNLVALYDLIERDLPQKYNEYKAAMGISAPRFGGVKGIQASNNTTTLFLENPTGYKIAAGYIFPIFGAFRSLLKYCAEKGEVKWLFDPLDIWNEAGVSLAQNTFETSSNPQLAGKDKQLWLSNYRVVETQSLRKLLKSRKQ